MLFVTAIYSLKKYKAYAIKPSDGHLDSIKMYLLFANEDTVHIHLLFDFPVTIFPGQFVS